MQVSPSSNELKCEVAICTEAANYTRRDGHMGRGVPDGIDGHSMEQTSQGNLGDLIANGSG